MRKLLPFLLAAFTVIGADVLTPGLFYRTDTRVVGATNLNFVNQHITNSTIDGVATSAIATNSAANKLDITNGAALNLTINGGRPTLDTRATSALFFGDSIVAGSTATTTANTWWRLVSDFYGWTYTNMAFGGAVVTDLNWESQRGYSFTNYYNSVLYTTPLSTATNFTIFAKVGVNDGADFPTTSGDHAAYLTHYYQSWLAFAANWATPGKTLATAATESGTWTDWNNYFGSAAGNSSTTSGDTLTFTTQGDAVYVAFPVSLTNTTSFGKFWVSIDGTAVELVDPNGTGFGNRNQWTTPSAFIPYSATNAFWAKRYAGYGQRRHTVTITATNNASLATVINWVAGSQQPIGPNSGPSVFLLENLNRAADATRDATYSALRAQVNQVASQLGGDGLQVAIIRPNSVYDSANSGDGIHPNDTGMVQVAQAVRQAVDRFRGLAIGAGSGSSGSGLSAAGSGLTDTSGTVSLGGTLSSAATITGGANGVSISRTQSGEPALELLPGASTYGIEVSGDTSFMGVFTSSTAASLYLRTAAGTVGSPSSMTAGNGIGRLYFMGYGGSTYQFGAGIIATAAENFSGSASGSDLNFYTVPDGTTTLQLGMTLESTGNLTLAYDLTADDITADAVSAASLDVASTAVTQATATRYNSGAGGGVINLQHARGTAGSPAALSSSDETGVVNFKAHNGTAFVTSAQIIGKAAENQSVGNSGGNLTFLTTPNASATPTTAMVLNASGSASFASSVSATSLILSGLTSGRIPLISTSGTIIDNSAFTYTSNTHLNVPTLYASAGIELSHATANTLTGSSGDLFIEGVKLAKAPATETLSYSTTTVTVTAGKGPNQSSVLTCTNDFTLSFSSVADNDGGTIWVHPAATNCTVTLSSPAYGPTGTTLTITGGTGSTNHTVLAWKATTVNSTNVINVNALNYYR